MNEHLVRPHPAPLTPANAVITDPAHRCRLDGCRVQIIGRRAYCGPDHRTEAARRRHAAHTTSRTGGKHAP